MTGGDYEKLLGYLGDKAILEGYTGIDVRAAVEPYLPAATVGQRYTLNIQVVSLTDFLSVAKDFGYNNGMDLIYSEFEK